MWTHLNGVLVTADLISWHLTGKLQGYLCLGICSGKLHWLIDGWDTVHQLRCSLLQVFVQVLQTIKCTYIRTTSGYFIAFVSTKGVVTYLSIHWLAGDNAEQCTGTRSIRRC